MAAGIGLYGCGQDTPLETTDAVAMSETVATGKVAVNEGDARKDIGTLLGLTEEQQGALEALRENRRAAAQSLRESLKGNGRQRSRKSADKITARGISIIRRRNPNRRSKSSA